LGGGLQQDMEVKAVITEAEARFERTVQSLGLFAGPIVFVALYPLTTRQMVRAGIIFDTLGSALIWGGLRLMCPILGLSGAVCAGARLGSGAHGTCR
jgi:ABC-type microcin C transport system permease subunit YejB